MMARYWRGRIRSSDVDGYAHYVRRTGIAGHRATPGNLGSMMLVRPERGAAEVVVISLWKSAEAIRSFAGDDPEAAVFYPEDDRFLVDRDLRARHYQVAAIELANQAGDARPADGPIPHSVYSDGRVQSLRFREPDGDATVGVITPGTYEFSTSAEERVTIVSGTLEVRHHGGSRAYGPGETYVIPRNDRFAVRADSPVAYVCRFVSPAGSP